jgi:hypothetical protein
MLEPVCPQGTASIHLIPVRFSSGFPLQGELLIRLEFETGETVIWKGRPASHFRYPLLAILFFIGIFVIKLGPVGQAIGASSVILWILFVVVSVVSLIIDKGKEYYLTSRRIISRKISLMVPDLSNVRMEQSRLGRLRGVGDVYFDSRDGRWIVFKHVKDPNQIVRSGLSMSGTPAGPVTTVVCNYCGARVPVGATKCPTCGADM